MIEEERYGKYELLRRIAMGGMAEIFLARETGLAGFERLVIIKRVLPSLAEDIDFIDMFLDEARLAARLTHPNIVHIYELDEVDGTYYIAMEYVAGGDLHELLGRFYGELLPLGDSLFIIGEVCAGLQFAHALAASDGQLLGVVHRDVTPKNVLLSVDGVVKVVDFGIAKARARISVTRPGDIKGTFSYMAPEQARGERVDRRADIYAVGALTYRLLTGSPAYPQVGEGLLTAVRASQFVRPRRINPDLPPIIEDIILRAMALDPRDRFPTCGAMRREILDASRQLGITSDSDAISALVRRAFPQVPGVTVPPEQAPSSSPAYMARVDPIREALRLASPDESTGLVSLPDGLHDFSSPDEHTEVSPFDTPLSDEDKTDMVMMPGDVVSSIPMASFGDTTEILDNPDEFPNEPTHILLPEADPPTDRSVSPFEMGMQPSRVAGNTLSDDDPTRTIQAPPADASRPYPVIPPPPPKKQPTGSALLTPSATPVVRPPKRPKRAAPPPNASASKPKSARRKGLLLIISGFALGFVLIVASLILILTPPSSTAATASMEDQAPAPEAQTVDEALAALVAGSDPIDESPPEPEPDPPYSPSGDGSPLTTGDASTAVEEPPAIDETPEPEPEPEPRISKTMPTERPPHRPVKTQPAKRIDSDPPSRPPPQRGGAKGFIAIIAMPSAKVFIDGRSAGNTPIAKREIDAGRHSIKLVSNEDPSKSKTVRVNVAAGGFAKVRERL